MPFGSVPMMGAPQIQSLLGPTQSVGGPGLLGAGSTSQHPLLGAAQGYGFPITGGLLGAISGAGGVGPFAQRTAGVNPQVAAQQAQMSQSPQDYSQLAMQLAGNPHAGPYSTAGNLVQPGSATNPSAGSTTGGSTGSSVAGSLLGALAKNPQLIKSGVDAVSSLFGGSPAFSAVGQAGANALGAELGSDAAAAAAAEATPALASLFATGAPTAAELATTADALAPFAVAPAAAAPAATAAATPAATGMLGAGAGAAAALGIAALPALLAAFVPDSAELTPSKIAQMENEVSAATKANGGLLGASYTQNPNGTINQAHYQTLSDLMTLESENPQEFAKAGGTGPITQYLQSLGYSPINWSAMTPNPNISQARGNTSGRQQ